MKQFQLEVLDLPGDPGCTFCKVPRSKRAYMFVNETQDCVICDVCIIALAERFASLGDPEPYQRQLQERAN